MIINDILKDFSQITYLDVQQQYFLYKDKIDTLMNDYNNLKKEGNEIAKILKQMQEDNIIDSHLSKLFLLAKKGQRLHKKNNQQNMAKITSYFQQVQDLSIKSLKIIFEIRRFFTGQEFSIFLEEEGRIFSFSIEDIEKHIGGIIPIYTNSLEKYINNLTRSSKSIAPELNKLGLNLKSLENDIEETNNLNSYLEFVSYHFSKNKRNLPENRKLEAAIYLWGLHGKNINFNSKKDRHSMHIQLGIYQAHGGVSDNIAMYKIGDAIQKTSTGLRNIEVKLHNGTISLTMIANGVKKLFEAFNAENPQEKIIKFFTANKNQLSAPIEREAQNEIEKKIKEIFKSLDID